MIDRATLLIFAALLLSGCAGSLNPVRQEESQKSARALFEDETSSYVIVVAHRACWAEGAPENSLAALSLCSGLGVDMAEIDIARTADGVLVLMHDDTIDRMTSGSGRVADHTLSQLKELRLRAGAGGREAALTDERIPILREALGLAAGRILLNLDLKADVFDEAIAVVRELGLEDQILTKLNIDPSDPRMQAVAARGQAMFMPIIRQCDGTGRPCSQTFASAAPQFQAVDPIAFEVVFNDEAFLAEGAATAKTYGERVWVNTLTPNLAAGLTDAGALSDPGAHWGRAIELGADIIQTDQPRQLIAYLERAGRRHASFENARGG